MLFVSPWTSLIPAFVIRMLPGPMKLHDVLQSLAHPGVRGWLRPCWRPPFHASPEVRKGLISSIRSRKKSRKKSVHKTPFEKKEILASLDSFSSFFSLALKSPNLWKFHFARPFFQKQKSVRNPGGPLVFQVGYHPRKRTFKTHPKHTFCRYENRP